MSKLLPLLLLVCVAVACWSAGCASGAPSEEEAGQVILDYLQTSGAAFTEDPNRRAEAVEVIEIGESFQQGRQTMWPIRVTIVKRGGVEEQAEFTVFKDVFGALKVLRRTD
jgi:hypothetical protein